MLKWLWTLLLVILIFGLLGPLVRQGCKRERLPGDVGFSYKGRSYFFPFASTLLFSVLLMLLSRWL